MLNPRVGVLKRPALVLMLGVGSFAHMVSVVVVLYQSIQRHVIHNAMHETFDIRLMPVRIANQIIETMTEYSFSLILASEWNLDHVDFLGERYSDSAFPATINGVHHVDFRLEALSLDDAISEAIGSVREAGLEPTRVELDPNTWRVAA